MNYTVPQGGMELPCRLKFSCACVDTKSLQKIKALLTKDLKDEDHAKIPSDSLMPSCKAFSDLEPGTSSSSGSLPSGTKLMGTLRYGFDMIADD